MNALFSDTSAKRGSSFLCASRTLARELTSLLGREGAGEIEISITLCCAVPLRDVAESLFTFTGVLFRATDILFNPSLLNGLVGYEANKDTSGFYFKMSANGHYVAVANDLILLLFTLTLLC